MRSSLRSIVSTLDLQNLYLDLKLPMGEGSAMLRAGRLDHQSANHRAARLLALLGWHLHRAERALQRH